MPGQDSYYTLNLTVQGADSAAYYGLTPTSNLQIAQGGASLAPGAASATVVNVYPQELQIQAPQGSVYAGVVIITSEDHLTGTFGVSPPINVAVVLTAYGAGRQIGQEILDPGSGLKQFNFPTGGSGMSQEDAVATLKSTLSGK